MGRKLLLAVVVLSFIAGAAFADEGKPVQLALFNPCQLFPESESIEGVSLGLLYASNMDVTGLSLALGVNGVTGNEQGVQWGLGNWVDSSVNGWQAGFLNYSGGRFVGYQDGAVNDTKGDLTGVQFGLLNWTDGFVHGVQAGIVNVAEKEFVGVQAGAFNYSAEMHGLQFGILNVAKDLKGVQVGLLNCNGNKKPLEYMVFVNASF